jgi:hypothetical protein
MTTYRCPIHQTSLTGGPIQYQCWDDGGHTVRAADISHEFHPAGSVTA